MKIFAVADIEQHTIISQLESQLHYVFQVTMARIMCENDCEMKNLMKPPGIDQK